MWRLRLERAEKREVVAALQSSLKDAGSIVVARNAGLTVADLENLRKQMKLAGGNAGHNGLKDITAALGTPAFWRLRLGIGHPRTLNLNQDVADFVLHAPRRDEATLIRDELERSLVVLADCAAGHLEAAMHKLHSRPKPRPDTTT